MNHSLAEDREAFLAHTAALWEELRDARIFLTGGTGFFGCNLLESFCWARDTFELDARITVLTRSPDVFRQKAPHLAGHSAVDVIAGDVRTFQTSTRFTHVIHAATDSSGALYKENPLEILDVIVEGTRHALDFARACGARRFLLTSSGAVYGPQPSEITHLPESYGGGPEQTDPRWTYAEGKRMAELLCALYHRQHGLECTIARCFAFVGPYLPLDAHFAIGNFIGNCLRGEPVEIHGDGTPYRSYLYAADLAEWLWTILVRGQPCRPYNVGAERDLSIAQLAHTVVAALDSPSEVQILGVPRPGALPERYVPSTARARTELGLQERVTLEEAIVRTAQWHRES